MEIRYQSTRGGEVDVAASRAILQGRATDGGLYVPQQFPTLETPWDAMCTWSYPEVAFAVMRPIF